MEKAEVNEMINSILDMEFLDLNNGEDTFKLKNENNLATLDYPHSNDLIDIYSNIQNNNNLKEIFLKNLKLNLTNSSETYKDLNIILRGYSFQYASKSALCFYTLLKLGYVEEALFSLSQRRHTSGILTKLLHFILKEDYRYFNLAQLTKLLNSVHSFKFIPNDNENHFYLELSGIIIRNRYQITKKKIKGVNIEINQDKRNIIEKIKYLNFDDKYNHFLNEIYNWINQDTSKVVNAGMIGNLRNFMQDLLTDIAKRIASEEKENIPKSCNSEMGNIRAYLKIKLELSDKDNSFINSYISVLHSEGGHSFTSNKEYFRLAINIGVEIILLILSKYQNKYSK